MSEILGVPSNLCLTNPPGDTAAFWSLRMTTVENLMVRATKSLLFIITMCQQFKTMPVMKYSTSLGQSASAVPVLVRISVLHKLLSFYSRDGEHPPLNLCKWRNYKLLPTPSPNNSKCTTALGWLVIVVMWLGSSALQPQYFYHNTSIHSVWDILLSLWGRQK